MTIPQMTPIQALFEDSNLELDLRKNADGYYLNEVARYAWMNWMTAYLFGREHRANILNKAAEIALAEANAEQEQYITAEEARKLGAGKVEFQYADGVNWYLCTEACPYFKDMAAGVIKYRAIKP